MRVSQWTEIYATDEAFEAHLANEKGKGPLATYHETAEHTFVLNPQADKDSLI